MLKKFELAGITYETDYDENFLCDLLKKLGIEPEISLEYTKRVIVYYSAAPKHIKQVYEKIAAEDGIKFHSVIMYVKRGLNNAVYNGKLKNIDDLMHGTVYDYDYGFTNKEFIALICDYMHNHGRLKSK